MAGAKGAGDASAARRSVSDLGVGYAFDEGGLAEGLSKARASNTPAVSPESSLARTPRQSHRVGEQLGVVSLGDLALAA